MAESVSVDTENLRGQAEVLRKEAIRCGPRLSTLQETISWIRQQDFGKSYEICRALAKQQEELAEQKKEMQTLAEALIRICDKYEKTEQRITEEQDFAVRILPFTPFAPVVPHHVEPVIIPILPFIRPRLTVISLIPLISQLRLMGIKTEE